MASAPTRREGVRRWEGFVFRPGDIVISTPRRSGTTWTQMICALLIFRTPRLPAPLWSLSPWLDTPDVPPAHIDAQLAAQRHRRFIKTHTPLSGIPTDPQVTYVVTARHPADAFVSRCHQDRLLGPPPPWPPPRPATGTAREMPPPRPAMGAPREMPPPRPATGPSREMPPPRPPVVTPREVHDALLAWIDEDEEPAATMRHLSEAWARRADPNVVLLHYDDLRSDLEGQMRRLAARLGITVDEPSWPALVEAATFDRMRARDDVLVPPPPGVVPDNSLFFRRGTSGAAREILNDEEMARYEARVARLGPPDLIQWLHRTA